jgi:hypothetical protein
MRHFEKSVMLQVLDNSWKEHLAAMDSLRQGIHLIIITVYRGTVCISSLNHMDMVHYDLLFYLP